jgi:hypothetical protein
MIEPWHIILGILIVIAAITTLIIKLARRK